MMKLQTFEDQDAEILSLNSGFGVAKKDYRPQRRGIVFPLFNGSQIK
jgi:hypothetical protein